MDLENSKDGVVENRLRRLRKSLTRKAKTAAEGSRESDEPTTPRPSRLGSRGGEEEAAEIPDAESAKRRRSTLLGNLASAGRPTRGYSVAHLSLHLTKEQREKKDETFSLPPDDYYLMEEHDNLGIFLEKPDQLPGLYLGETDLLKLSETEKPPCSEEGMESEKEQGSCEPEAPPDYVFPVQRNAVELQTKLNAIRSLRSYQENHGKKYDQGKCYYGEDDIDLSFLTAKPITFLILGKPGIGKTTLGAKLAEQMHSVHLTPENIIEYFRGPKEPLNSVHVNEKLESGDSIGDGVVIELLLKRTREFDVLHRGYVLEGFPMVTSDDTPVYQQLEILSKMTISPAYLIIMHMQDKDLYKRRINQKLDPNTGRVYTRQQYRKSDPDEIILHRHFQGNPDVTSPFNEDGRKSANAAAKPTEMQDAKYNVNQEKSKLKHSVGSSNNPVTEEQSDTEKRTGLDNNNSRTSMPNTDEVFVNDLDFPQLAPEVLARLFYRTEDFNIIVSDDLESFRKNAPDLQDYVNRFDKRRVLEVDAYWAPTIIFHRVWEFCEATGIQPVPVPVQIMRPFSMYYYKKQLGGEDAGEDDDDESDDSEEDDDDDEATKGNDEASEDGCEEDEQQPDIDWVSAMRAVCVRGLVDPRFRWRISRWQNFCPVALKLGRCIAGKPELSVSFMDKVFFMSTKHAADQFINNPRPYLLPKMPTSPIKFIVLGHPLAGKTTFAKELAQMIDGVVIDISKEVDRRFPAVKRDFLWKKRLKYALEACHLVNRDNMLRWQRQERTRRRDMHAWIENYLKELAEAEIEEALAHDREALHRMRVELRKQSEEHAMGDTFVGDGLCQPDDATVHFNWKKFISEAFSGKREWTHQQMLQLAWDLFHQHRLYYKRRKQDIKMKLVNDFSSSESEDGLASPTQRASRSTVSKDSLDDDEEEDKSVDDLSVDLEQSDEDSEIFVRKKKHIKKKRKKKCAHLEVKPVEPEEILEPFLFESFDVDPEDPEVEESVRMRFPTIPFELVDLVPPPPLVGDLDPVVQMIVEEKLANEEIAIETMPVEIFIEILKRACAEVEVVYRKRNRNGALSGGWIVENFPLEIEKWRAVLRNPQICPDQVFLMLDLTEGNMTIWSRFKKLYKILHPPGSQQQREVLKGGSRSNSDRRATSPSGMPGEGGPPAQVLLGPRSARQTLTGEDNQNNDDYDDNVRGHVSTDEFGTDFETANEGQAPGEVNEAQLELVSRSHFMLSLLPKDNLTEVASMTPSERDLINRDLQRTQTAAFSDVHYSDENMLEQTMLGHEKYILESVNLEAAESGDDDDDEDGSNAASSLDLDEIQKRKEAVLRSKMVYGEMTVCLEEVDAFHQHHADGRRVSADDDGTIGMKNPPATPETGGAGHNSDVEEGENHKKDKWGVPVPSAIAKGEIELSPEEFELKAQLENEIRRLSLPEDNIKTPTEVGSTSTVPGTAASVEGGSNTNPIYKKLLTTKIESPKRKFFAQVRMFNEFWNMAHPVCNEQKVRHWEVGLCDEDTALEKALFIWNELENRFDSKAKMILETELREEDEEILESIMRWGQPFAVGDIRHRFSKERGDEEEEDDDEDIDNDVDDSESELDESDDQSDSQKERDELTALERFPDLYWKALKRREAERCFGDFKYYCPVFLADHHILRKGSTRFACKFKDRLYYCTDENSQLRFLTNPKQFISRAGPPTPPPPRICITGSPGCLQEEIAQELCTEFKVCYINFRQRLHEIIHARIERDIGPENTMRIISKEDNQRALKESKPGDDLLYYVGEMSGEDGEFAGHVKFSAHQIPTALAVKESVFGMINIPSQEIFGQAQQMEIHDAALKSLGLMSKHKIETVPLNSFHRTERLTDRRWEKLTRVEVYIKAFLENGIQLPDDVLDQFVLPLWREKPFTEMGFILVGFPNTNEDVHYMLRRNLIPEHVFVMECKSVVIRNRLIVPAVDRWHRVQNPSGKKQRRLTIRTQRAKLRLQKMLSEDTTEVFPYQLEGRPDVDEYENETWTYNDAVSRDIARALRYYHSIYSLGLEKMKKFLNKERIDWTPVDTNTGLHQGKHKVLDSAAPMLKYRSNIFEDTVRLSFAGAQALLDRGIFTLSRLERWCPVEIWKGNTGINLWSAPAVKKIPYLHRRYIYFIAGEKNAKIFEENTWELINQVLPPQPTPLVCMVLGMPKSGKTTLAQNIANRLGLLYVSCVTAVEQVLTHEFATEWAPMLYEVNPALAASGHQPMRLAKEVMEYVREGRAIPRFMVYRCLDHLLMNPKAQYSGVVFDDFPCLSDELIELNYREMTPCIVLRLKIPISEAYDRCDRNRSPEPSPDEVPAESRDCIDFMWDQYDQASKETLKWFADEYQNINVINGTDSPEIVFQNATEICVQNQKKIQSYLKNAYEEKPNTLDGTCPITSNLFHRLTPDFGFFCPVALNDMDELISIKEITDLGQVVDYKGQIFLFSSKIAVRRFVSNPKRYTVPGCLRTPPKDLPQTLVMKPEDFESQHERWGFMDFDPVLYYANHNFKGLQRGDPKYCVVYRNKLYVFINKENQSKFLTKPSQYWNLLLPMKLPPKSEPINYEKVTPYSYLNAKGVIPILRKLLKLMAEKRPRGPFMNVDQCAALYMGYYLKAQNMNSHFQVRQKYRDAMFKMSTLTSTTKDFLTELQNYYGCRPRNMPERLRNQLDEFVKYEHMPVEQKVVFPKIPDLTLGYDAVPAPFTEPQVTRKVRRMMESLKNVEVREKLDSMKAAGKKKAAEEAAARAAQDAKDAADLAKKMGERSLKRFTKRSSSSSDSTRQRQSRAFY